MLGIAGAFVATWIGQSIGWYRPDQGAGFTGATLGAIVVLVIWHRFGVQRVVYDPGVDAHPLAAARLSIKQLKGERVVIAPREVAQSEFVHSLLPVPKMRPSLVTLTENTDPKVTECH